MGSGSCRCKYKRSENGEIDNGCDHISLYTYIELSRKKKNVQNSKTIKIKTANNKLKRKFQFVYI